MVLGDENRLINANANQVNGSKNTISNGNNNMIHGSHNKVTGHGNKMMAMNSTVSGDKNELIGGNLQI